MLKFRRFTKPHVLKQMGRPLLGRFFDRFNDGLAARNVALPSAELDDAAYFEGLAGVLMASEGLPDNLSEALFAIDEMANDEGQERLQSTMKQAGLDLELDLNATHADLALQVWLRDPKLLADQHNEQQFTRLSSFEHYGSKTQGKDGTPLRLGLSPAKAVTESNGDRTTTPPDAASRSAS